MNALVFLYRKVLEKPLDEGIDAMRAERKVNVPVVLTRLAFPDAHPAFLAVAGQVKPNWSCSTQPRVRPVRMRR